MLTTSEGFSQMLASALDKKKETGLCKHKQKKNDKMRWPWLLVIRSRCTNRSTNKSQIYPILGRLNMLDKVRYTAIDFLLDFICTLKALSSHLVQLWKCKSYLKINVLLWMYNWIFHHRKVVCVCCQLKSLERKKFGIGRSDVKIRNGCTALIRSFDSFTLLDCVNQSQIFQCDS